MKVKLLTCYLCLSSAVGFAQTVETTIPIRSEDSFLNFPVSESSDQVTAGILLDGRSLDEFEIRLAGGEPQYWVFFDVTKYRGKTLVVQVDGPEGRRELVQSLHAAPRFPGQDTLYREKYRPQVTFSSRRGWHNDPNGLIHYNGEYHMYYQHNPYGWDWGNMHWGHAVSRDLLHWEELGDVLFTPDRRQTAFSGTATVDPENTAGFRRDGVDPLIVFYTRTGSGEHIALSFDEGRTFEEYEGNPVLKHRGRDPRVFRHEPSGQWVMAVYDESATRPMGLGQNARLRRLAIHTSPDLKLWTYQSSIEGIYECPEMFEIAVDEQPGVTKWVVYDADGEYLVGRFDGKTFTPEQSFKQYNYGGGVHFYASQIFANIPKQDGRRLQVGWVRDVPATGMPFNQSMTFPTELKLRKTFDGFRLTPTPIREIASLHRQSHVFTNKLIQEDAGFTAAVKGEVLHIIAEFDPGDALSIGLNINGYRFEYDELETAIAGINYIPPARDNFKIEAVVDKTNIQLFVNDGEVYTVAALNSVDAEKVVEAFARGRREFKAILKRLEVHELRSIWR